jgi:hypothetical protein
VPSSIEVSKLILIGPSSGGSLRSLRWFNRGRRYVPVIGRKFSPETLSTFVSLYQDLPSYRQDLFVDVAGNDLGVDLYDVSTWQEHGWSFFAPALRRRLERHPRPDLFGSASEREAFVRQTLDEARRLHDLLARDVSGSFSTGFHVVQSVSLDTPARAVLVAEDGQWQTLFTGDRRVDRDPKLRALATTSGDGHATSDSQLWLTPRERAAIVDAPLTVAGQHFEIINHPQTHRYLTEILSQD